MKNRSLNIVFRYILCLLFSMNVLTYPAENVFSVEGAIFTPPAQAETFNVSGFYIPEVLGTIKEKHNAFSEKIVFHIQDAHCNYGSQHKIADIIEYLSARHNVRIANLEGGSGEYDLSIFRGVPEDDVREMVSDHFVKEGMVNGAEFFAINNPDKMYLWGIENEKRYMNNLNAYRDSLTFKEDAEKGLASLRKALNKLKTEMYPPPVLALDTQYYRYENGAIEFKEYLEALIKKAQRNDIDLSGYPNLSILRDVLKIESHINFKKANSERDQIIKQLKNTLSRVELAALTEKMLLLRSERIPKYAFYVYLAGLSASANIEKKDYLNFFKNLEYLGEYERLSRGKVVEESDSLVSVIKNKFFTNKQQKELNTLSGNLDLLEKLFNAELVKNDYMYIKKNPGQFKPSEFTSFIKARATANNPDMSLYDNISKLDFYTGKMLSYYDSSFARDEAFMENIRFSGEGPQFAVVVTGGFHTENLCNLLKDQKISYVSIMPHFINEEGYESPYYNLLAGKTTGLQRELFKVFKERYGIQVASVLNGMGADVWGRAHLDAFRVAVLLTEGRIRGELEGRGIVTSIQVKDDNVIEFTFEDETKSEMTVEELMYEVHEREIDNQMVNGRFEDISAEEKERIVNRLIDFLWKVNAPKEMIDKISIDLLSLQTEGPDGKAYDLLRYVYDVTFDGHAGGMGIRVNAKFKGKDGRMTDEGISVVLHEIIAALYGDHVLSELVQKAFKSNNETPVDFDQYTDPVREGLAIWDIKDQKKRSKLLRDYAAGAEDVVKTEYGLSLLKRIESLLFSENKPELGRTIYEEYLKLPTYIRESIETTLQVISKINSHPAIAGRASQRIQAEQWRLVDRLTRLIDTKLNLYSTGRVSLPASLSSNMANFFREQGMLDILLKDPDFVDAAVNALSTDEFLIAYNSLEASLIRGDITEAGVVELDIIAESMGELIAGTIKQKVQDKEVLRPGVKEILISNKIGGTRQPESMDTAVPFNGEAWIKAGAFFYLVEVDLDTGKIMIQAYKNKNRGSKLQEKGAHSYTLGTDGLHSATVGRASGLALSIEDPRLSRKHFNVTIIREGDQFSIMVSDMGSSNGTEYEFIARGPQAEKAAALEEAKETIDKARKAPEEKSIPEVLIENFDMGIELFSTLQGDEVRGMEETEELRNVPVIPIPDIHADLDGLRTILAKMGIITRKTVTLPDGRSSIRDKLTEFGKKTRLVQMGDVIDRGKTSNDSLRVLFYLRYLKERYRAAQKEGYKGNLTRLLGNHELIYLTKYDTSSEKMGEYYKKYNRGWDDNLYQERPGEDVTRLVRLLKEDIQNGDLRAAERIGGITFVHAGINDELRGLSDFKNLSDEALVERMNKILDRAVRVGEDTYEFDFSHPVFEFSTSLKKKKRSGKIKEDGTDRARMTKGGAFSAYYSKNKDGFIRSGIRQVVSHDAKTFRQSGRLEVTDDANIMCVDCGLTGFYGSGREFLVFLNGKVYSAKPKIRVLGKVISQKGAQIRSGINIEKKDDSIVISHEDGIMTPVQAGIKKGTAPDKGELLETIAGTASNETLPEYMRRALFQLYRYLDAITINDVVVLDNDSGVKGIYDSTVGTLYVREDVLEDPLALIYAFGEGRFMTPVDGNIGRIGLNESIMLWGVGEDIKDKYIELIASGKILLKTDFQAVIDAIYKEPGREMSYHEITLIGANGRSGKKGLELFFGMKEFLEPDLNRNARERLNILAEIENYFPASERGYLTGVFHSALVNAFDKNETIVYSMERDKPGSLRRILDSLSQNREVLQDWAENYSIGEGYLGVVVTQNFMELVNSAQAADTIVPQAGKETRASLFKGSGLSKIETGSSFVRALSREGVLTLRFGAYIGTLRKLKGKNAYQFTVKNKKTGNIAINEELLPAFKGAAQYTIGRASANDIAIRDKSLSRNHLTIEITKDGICTITDMGSLNGTYAGFSSPDGRTGSLIGKVIDRNNQVIKGSLDIDAEGKEGYVLLSHEGLDKPVEVPLETGAAKTSEDIRQAFSDLLKKTDLERQNLGLSALTQDERAALKALEDTIKSVSQVVIIGYHENVKGFFDNNILYINEELAENPLALLHELGEGNMVLPEMYKNIIAENMPIEDSGANHTFLRGGGSDARNAMIRLVKRVGKDRVTELAGNNPGELIKELNKEIKKMEAEGFPVSRSRDKENPVTITEEALIMYNARQGRGGAQLLYGLQNLIDPAGNIMFTRGIRGLSDRFRRNTMNIFLIPTSSRDGARSKEQSFAKGARKEFGQKHSINTRISGFTDADMEATLQSAIEYAQANPDKLPKILVQCITKEQMEMVEKFIQQDPENRSKVIFVANDSQGEKAENHIVDISKVLIVGSSILDDARRTIDLGLSPEMPEMMESRRVLLNFLSTNGIIDLDSGVIRNMNAKELDDYINRIRTGLEILRISRIDWESFVEWKNAQDAVMQSL